MDPKTAAAAALNTSSFEPLSDFVQEGDSDTILVYLPGFTKEQLRVQLTRAGVLKISGTRPTGENRWSSFQKDFPVSANCDVHKISAKFEDGILYVRQPKLPVPADLREENKTQHEPPVQKTEAKTTKTEQENVSETKETEKEEEKTSRKQDSYKMEAEKSGYRLKMAREKVTVVAAMLLAFALGIYISNLVSVFFGEKRGLKR